MARIAGVNIPVQKHTWVGLTQIYGVGKTRAYQICATAGVAPETRIRDLTESELKGFVKKSPNSRLKATCAVKWQ